MKGINQKIKTMKENIKRIAGVMSFICALGLFCFSVITVINESDFVEIISFLSLICIEMVIMVYVFLTEYGIINRNIRRIVGVVNFIVSLLLVCFVLLIANGKDFKLDLKDFFFLIALFCTGIITMVYVILTKFGVTKLNESEILKLQSRRKGLKKILITVLCVWCFIHTFLLLRSFPVRDIELHSDIYKPESLIKVAPSEKFYPFTAMEGKWDWNNEYSQIHNFDLRFYDTSEYFVYIGGILFIYFLYGYLKGSKNKMVTNKESYTTNI